MSKLKEIRDKYTTGTKSDVEIIRGAKHTGKTTYLIDKVLNESIKDVVFVHPNAKNQKIGFEGKNGKIKVYFINSIDFQRTFDKNKIENVTLIIDEAMKVINSNTNEKFTKELISLLSTSRHQNTSVYLVYHFLRKVSQDIITLADRLRLFKSNEPINKLEEAFPELQQEIEQGQKKVNNHKTRWYSEVININY